MIVRSALRSVIPLCAVLALLNTARAQTPPVFDLTSIVGSWSCEGYFIRNHRPIASSLTVTQDAASGALVLHHDDKPPGSYHALEGWSEGKDGTLKSSISDAYGMRWFAGEASGANTRVLDRVDHGVTVERFVYAMHGARALQVDWSVAPPGKPLIAGDTLRCRRVD